ncbi:MAG: BrnT family toxin [Nitrospirota bacterium]|nr:BrnT family toxin [Nitrospirota bacterium]
MMDYGNIDGFDWDAANVRKSEDKHGVTQVEAEQVFFNMPVVHVPDLKHSEVEPRFYVLGKTNEGRLLHITFTLRFGGRKIRVISARAMHRTERRIYEEKAQNNPQV